MSHCRSSPAAATAKRPTPARPRLLAQFELAHVARHQFRSLSGGEAQRLMLARAVAAAPQLLLIDEPTAQLDVVTAEKVNTAIGSMAAPERIILVATHDPRTRDSCTGLLDLTEFAFHAAGPLAET